MNRRVTEPPYLYHLTPVDADVLDYDCAEAFIVSAKDSKEARRLAAARHGDEGADFWRSSRTSVCRKIGYVHQTAPLRSRVVMRDFSAG